MMIMHFTMFGIFWYFSKTKQKHNHKSEKVPGTAENASVLSELVYESRSFRLNTRSFRVQCAHSFTRRHKESSVLHQISFCSPVPIRPLTIVCRIHSLRHLLQPKNPSQSAICASRATVERGIKKSIKKSDEEEEKCVDREKQPTWLSYTNIIHIPSLSHYS